MFGFNWFKKKEEPKTLHESSPTFGQAPYEGTFIGGGFYDSGGVFGYRFGQASTEQVEQGYISNSRRISLFPDVALGIEEIMRDLYVKKDPFDLRFQGKENRKIINIFEEFCKNVFTSEGDIVTPQNIMLFNYIRQVYIDGRFCVYVKRENNEISFVPLDPVRMTHQGDKILYEEFRGERFEISPDDIIQADFGLVDQMGARFGFLKYCYKYANQLQSLQDMLIPLRYRRSTARRVFNVDVSDLPAQRAEAYITNLSRNFKYKKVYDTFEGRIIAQDNKDDNHVGIVEDYWIANRSGGKGTSVDVLDESGGFSDSLEDITYFNKKLYQSMFIPLRRIFESDADYDYTNSSIEVDELRFASFLDRIRFVFDSAFTAMFHKYLEHREIKDFADVSVRLKYDNWFEKQRRKEELSAAIDLWDDAKEVIGVAISAETAIETIFNLTAADIEAEQDKIKSELDPESLYYKFYVGAGKDE